MGFVGSLLGSTKGSAGGAGLNYSAQSTPMEVAATGDQGMQALAQQQAFVNALAGQNGIQNQSDVYNQYNQLAQGQGPSVASNMLNQQTNQNIANQAALMAGQRGSSANPALIARLAANQGANLQQQAAGQAATLRAQEQLAALGQMGNISGQQVSQQGNALQNYNSNMLGAIANLNNARAGLQGNMNTANASVSQVAAKGQQDLFGKAMQGLGSAIAMNKGGEVKGPSSKVGQYFNMLADGGEPTILPPQQQSSPMPDPNSESSGGGGMNPGDAMAMAKAIPMASGSVVPGTAKVKGDSLKNDKVPALLSPKEIVLPRSVTMAKDAPQKAAEFVAAILAKKSSKKK